MSKANGNHSAQLYIAVSGGKIRFQAKLYRFCSGKRGKRSLQGICASADERCPGGVAGGNPAPGMQLFQPGMAQQISSCSPGSRQHTAFFQIDFGFFPWQRLFFAPGAQQGAAQGKSVFKGRCGCAEARPGADMHHQCKLQGNCRCIKRKSGECCQPNGQFFNSLYKYEDIFSKPT